MLLFLFLVMLVLAIPLWRFLAVFVPVAMACWTVVWVATTPGHGMARYAVALTFVLFAARAVNRWTHR
ncbi:hypothetical protein [Frankia sp. R82]|uniref:hypothetical protein n=1 Tax=Frankia sp. R82 TaxID=2950553 RepID=UPI0020441720|nr:hypothetical protein [Frankia sp. R82]MCM3882146.1 hypothetical protein [Frankia sp. R82]